VESNSDWQLPGRAGAGSETEKASWTPVKNFLADERIFFV